MNQHRYARFTKEGKTYLGYIYSKHVDIMYDGFRYNGRGIMYDGIKPLLIPNTEGLEIEYLT